MKITFFGSFSVGEPKHYRIMAGAVEGEYFVGSKAEELRGLLKLRHPIEHGIVTNWNDMEHVWDYTYNELKIQQTKEVWMPPPPPIKTAFRPKRACSNLSIRLCNVTRSILCFSLKRHWIQGGTGKKLQRFFSRHTTSPLSISLCKPYWVCKFFPCLNAHCYTPCYFFLTLTTCESL